MYVCYICIYVIYMYMYVCFFVRRFLTCLLFGFFVKNTKVYASRQWSMERGARGRWAGGNPQGSPPSESTVLCCCCCWTFRAISIKTVKMTKIWRAKCVCKVCVAIWCDTRTRASPTHDAPSVWVLHNTRTERQWGDLNTHRFVC